MDETTYGQDVWLKLGQLLVERRTQLGEPKRAPFAKRNGFANDRVLFDLEKGRRANYDAATLAQVERAYRWPYGAIERVLNGEDPEESVTPSELEAGVASEQRLSSDVLYVLSQLEVALAALNRHDGHNAYVAITRAQTRLAQSLPRIMDADRARASEATEEQALMPVSEFADIEFEQPGDPTYDYQDEYDLVADDANGYSHEDEDEQREMEP